MIHDSVRETTLFFDVIIKTKPFQSTPPRRRRRFLPDTFQCPLLVSIHASAKEVTFDVKSVVSPEMISIHASAREATALITKIHLKHHISF